VGWDNQNEGESNWLKHSERRADAATLKNLPGRIDGVAHPFPPKKLSARASLRAKESHPAMNPADHYAPAPRRARVEIIPLIDVIFFLLATFVLFTLSLNKIKSIDVVLPIGGTEGADPAETLFLQATAGGAYFWKLGDSSSPELLTAAELTPRLAAYARREHPRVLIRGDNQATFGHSIFALDAVRLAGITQVSVETKPSPTGK
jgi:biopolymer transport protein ExbD